jgi:hypothetical protein
LVVSTLISDALHDCDHAMTIAFSYYCYPIIVLLLVQSPLAVLRSSFSAFRSRSRRKLIDPPPKWLASFFPSFRRKSTSLSSHNSVEGLACLYFRGSVASICPRLLVVILLPLYILTIPIIRPIKND